MTTELYHTICEWLRDLIADTQWEGHVFAVGGCCRDEIMGYEIKDLDLAIDLPNGGVKFARWLQKKRLTIGHPIYFLKFGTAKLRLRRFPDDEIEMVQTRREQYTKETSRCPEVCFGSIEDDCYRRDFTVNSLYYDITRRKMVDITGLGIPDMQAGLLRTPLDPDATFNDDPVRILRGLRFANRFGWKIDPPSLQAMLSHIDRLTIVSRERCHSELCKMLNGPDPVQMMQTLKDTGALAIMIPEMAPVIDSRHLWSDAMARLRHILRVDPEAPTRFRLAALMLDLRPSPREAARETRRIMTTLRFDRPIVADVAFLVHFARLNPEDLDNPRRVREVQNLAVTRERFNFLLRFIADLGRDEDADELRQLSHKVESSGKSGFTNLKKLAKELTPAKNSRRGGRRTTPRRKKS
ncbi:MAG: CCA tRNA nucleotidyltransferase [Bacteroidales bacterium]|nr:CCA tRNA nucleotidyltransferase [Bacteroidales bacterium]